MIDKDNKSIYGLEFSYETIPNELNLFDYDAFKQYKGDFYCVVTNLLTGQPEYMKYTGDDRTNTVTMFLIWTAAYQTQYLILKPLRTVVTE